MTVMTQPASSVDAAGTGTTRRPRRPQRPRRVQATTGMKSRGAPFWLLTPAGLVVIALIATPIGFLVFTSFTDFDQSTLFTGQFDMVGFAQYTRLLSDPEFWWALVRTLLFTAAMVAGSVVIGMGVANMLTRLGTVMRYIVTIVLIMAWEMPNVASSQVWLWLFQPGYGVVNWLLTKLRIFGDVTNVNWAQDPSLAFFCIWMLVVWQAVPFIAVTLYAAQSQMSPDYAEAARLDGAGEWRIYWNVVVPFLKPTLLLMTVLSIIWDFNVFNQIWLVSQGGPDGATTTLGIYSYKMAFVGMDIGRGSAAAIVTSVLLMLFSALYIRNLIRSGEDL
ncbi:carbohydrate ABC transporter permease [Microbacterium sp. NPDC057659]|uniref:carbohydrate ABC transporter permease n=1 Tax=Microbacterium sp. NPDC057659 TaxID=3346198 RepID=UPI00366BF6F2